MPLLHRRGRVGGDLSRPGGSSIRLGDHVDPDAFGRASEGIARLLGTGKFLAIQTVFVFFWILLNTVGLVYHWDKYPFILLNLAFSTQAAYAAPLILLAQNRQDERDRVQIERDREVATRTQADTEFLARELSSVRLAMADVVSVDDLSEAFERLEDMVTRIEASHGHAPPPGRSQLALPPAGNGTHRAPLVTPSPPGDRFRRGHPARTGGPGTTPESELEGPEGDDA